MGPSPFLVFAASIPVPSWLCSSCPCRSSSSASTRRRPGRALALGPDPGRCLRRAHPPAGRRHGRAVLGGDGCPPARPRGPRRDRRRRALGDPGHRGRRCRRLRAPDVLPGQRRSARCRRPGRTTGFALSCSPVLIVAPMCEEIMFRGFATTAWVRGRSASSAASCSVHSLFAVRPRPDRQRRDRRARRSGVAVVGFGTRVPVAIALGWLFVRRGTIWASFGLHAAFNGILLIIAEAAARHPTWIRLSRGAPPVECPVRARR